jgi:hypothetical protein
MTQSKLQTGSLLLVALGMLSAACGSSSDGDVLLPSDPAAPDKPAVGGGGVPGSTGEPVAPSSYLDSRTADYGAALRIATEKLALRLPTLAEIKAIEGAADKKAAYAQQIDALLAGKDFAASQVKFWRDTFKTGGNGQAPAMGQPNLDSAVYFASSVVVAGKPFTDLFTATAGTCPTFDAAAGTFAAANCGGAQATAGVLSDPGLMKQYYANMAFRRARFVQETFVCSKFPAEAGEKSVKMGAGYYSSPWDVNSISGKLNKPDARVDFHDASAVVCAGCHTTLNHQAPLFMYFNEQGVYNAAQVGVVVPLPGNPRATLVDFLPAGEAPAWRFGKAAADLPAFGAAMAQDPTVQRCAVTRAWNYAFSRGNVVDDISPVPATVSDPLLAKFKNGFNYKNLLRDVFVSDDFTKF